MENIIIKIKRALGIYNEIEELKIIAGKRFFDKNLQDIFPERDFYLATEVNKFNFVLKVEKDQDGMNYIKRIDIN